MWNAAAERMFGWKASEVIGRNPLQCPQDEAQNFAEMQNRVTAGESLRELEGRRCTRDGSVLEVTISADPLRDSSGKLIGWVNLLTDVTERKRAREQLEQHQ